MKNIVFFFLLIFISAGALMVGCKSEPKHVNWTIGKGTVIQIDTLKREGNADSLQVYIGFEYQQKFHVAKKTYAFTDTISMWEDREIMIDSLKPWYIVIGKQTADNLIGIDSMVITGKLLNTKGEKVRGRIRNKFGQRSFYFDNGMYYVVLDNSIDNQFILDGVGDKVKYLNIHKQNIETSSLVQLDANFMFSYDTVRADLIFDWNEDSWMFEAKE